MPPPPTPGPQGGRVAVKVIDCWSRMEGSPVARGSLEGSLPCSSPQGPQAAVVEALLSRSLAHPHCVSTYTHGVSVEQVRAREREGGIGGGGHALLSSLSINQLQFES